jgi:ubiquinone/menaquinone biosynthesis C-methylase UbiE
MAAHSGDHAHIFDTTQWQRLESPERLARLDPARMIARLNLRHGMHVADLGSGTGVFTAELAAAVGPAGRVYALDNSQEMLNVIIAKHLPANVHPMLADLSRDIPLPDESLDCCFIAFVLHEIADQPALMAQMHRFLKPGGTLAVLEFRDDAPEGAGPPKPRRVGISKLVDLLIAQGFVVPEVRWQADREYLLVATRPDPSHAR